MPNGDDLSPVRLQHLLTLGTVLQKFYTKKKPEKRSFEVNYETGQIIWRRQAGRVEGYSKYSVQNVIFKYLISSDKSFKILYTKVPVQTKPSA